MTRLVWLAFFAVMVFWAGMVYKLALRLPGSAVESVAAGVAADPALLQSLLVVEPPVPLGLRDPFQPLRAKASSPSISPKAVIVEAPPIAIDAILWGTPPVAILRSAGQTQVVKVGQQAFGAEVQEIRRSEVLVRFAGRVHVLRKTN